MQTIAGIVPVPIIIIMAKYHAFGARLLYNDGSGTWISVAGIRDLGGFSMSADTVDVTCHSSPGKYREYRSALKDGGEITTDLVFDPEDAIGQGILLGKFDTQDVTKWRIEFATANKQQWQAPGIVTNFEASNPVEGEISASLTIKVVGRPLFEKEYVGTVAFDGLSEVGGVIFDLRGIASVDGTAITGQQSASLDGTPFDFVSDLAGVGSDFQTQDGTVITLVSIDTNSKQFDVKVQLDPPA